MRPSKLLRNGFQPRSVPGTRSTREEEVPGAVQAGLQGGPFTEGLLAHVSECLQLQELTLPPPWRGVRGRGRVLKQSK